jgi:hypothetical protein
MRDLWGSGAMVGRIMLWLAAAGYAAEQMAHAVGVRLPGPTVATAGIPRYWIVDRDSAETVTMYELSGDAYVVRELRPLDEMLNTQPSDHLG